MMVPDLEEAAENGEIESIETVETAEGHKVLVNLKARPAEQRYLTVRREPDKPRNFVDVSRLFKMLRKIFPKGEIISTCEEPFDPATSNRRKK